MKSIIKKIFITYLVVICCIYTPTAQAANWSFGGFNFGNGSLNIVKDGVKISTAAVDSAPITSNLGKKILSGALRGAGFLGALSIAADIAEEAIDWVLDPANNAVKVKYKESALLGYSFGDGVMYSSALDAARGYANMRVNASGGQLESFSVNQNNTLSSDFYNVVFKYVGNPTLYTATNVVTSFRKTQVEKTIPIPTVAQKLFDMAKSGKTAAQADVLAAIQDLVNAGTYDQPINQAIQQAIDNGTLPKTGTDTGTGTGTNTNTNTNPQIDTSGIIAAIQSLSSIFVKSLTDNFNAITNVINTSIDKLLNKQDQLKGEVVNVGSKVEGLGGKVVGVGEDVKDVGGKVVGVGEAVKDVGGKVVGVGDNVKAVGDKVVGLSDDVNKLGDKLGQKADAAGEKVGSKVDAAGEKVGSKVDAAGEKVGSKVDAAGEKVGQKVDAAGEKTAQAVKEATKEITKKMEETKPKDFELPAFCSWASKVCDFIDWVKLEPDIEGTPVPTDNTPLKNPSEFDKDYINVTAQCPADVVRDIPLPGRSFSLVFAMSPVCDFASTYLRPVIIFLAYIYGALSIANAFKVGG